MKNIFRILAITALGAAFMTAASCTADYLEESDIPMAQGVGDTPVLEFDGENRVNVSKDGGEYEFSFKANLPWMVESRAAWITITSPIRGKGGNEPVKVTFTVPRNGSVNPRDGEIRIWITDDAEQIVKVNQEATPIQELGSKWYVKENGTGDGSSWEQATTLSNALKQTVDNDKIYVAAGTYYPTELIPGGNSEMDKTFYIGSNISILGGYPANAKDGDTADPAVNKTILSGAIEGGPAYHVMVVAAAKSDLFNVNISGVTITGGLANTKANTLNINGAKIHRSYGAGIVVGNSRATITDCIITANKSPKYCGGLYNADGAETKMVRCEVSDNTSGGNGAGIWNGATLEMYECLIKGNTNTGVGAGLYCLDNNKGENHIYIYNCAFLNNATDASKASRRGGGAYFREGSQGVIVNTTFNGNTGANGSALALYGTATRNSKLSVISCTVANNDSKFYGAVEAGPNTTLNIYNTIVSGNVCTNAGYENIVITEKDSPVQELPAVLSYSVNGTTVYGKDNNVVSGASFDFETMLSAINNGVMALSGGDNPAVKNGMPLNELSAISAGITPDLDTEMLSVDQKGNKRTSAAMGAYVGK